jgi:hypothetical protein
MIVVEHGVDDRGLFGLGVDDEIAHGVGGLIEKGLNDGLSRHGCLLGGMGWICC